MLMSFSPPRQDSHHRILTMFVVLGSLAAAPAFAQQRDTTAKPIVAAEPLKPPIGPRRAFLFSFLVPGYSQSVLGRNKAAATFMLIEAVSIAMIRESAADAHEARRMANDTVVVSYGARACRRKPVVRASATPK